MSETSAVSICSVTFLFTDIEGSTRLWEQQPEPMHRDLARHDALLRAAIEDNDGRVFKTVGDAFYAAFTSPRDAVEAAVAAQRALRRELAHVRVRMAVHSGHAEERDADYFGPALNHVARLLAAGHGGQVLLSRSTAEEVRPILPEDTSLRLLGEHRLRDIAATETIFQLAPPDLPSKFPPLNTLDVAFRRGVVRATAIAAAVLLIMLGLTTWAIRNRQAAVRNARLANKSAAAATKEAQRADENAGVAEAQRRDAVEARGRATGLAEARRVALAEADKQRKIAVAKRAEAERQREENRRRLVRLNVTHGMRLVDQGDLFGALLWLVEAQKLDQKVPEHAAVHRMRFAAVLQECPKLGQVWFHEGGVTAARWSPDGRCVVTAGVDGTACVRDVITGRTLGRPLRHGARINDACFSPDGRRVVTVSDDKTARVWEAATGEPVSPPLKQSARLNQASFSPDGRRVVTACEDGTAQVWAAGTGAPVLPPLKHRAEVNGAWFSPDGRRIVTATDRLNGTDGEARLWDAVTGAPLTLSLRHAASHFFPVNYAEFSPDGRRIASAGNDDAVKIWEVGTDRPIQTLRHGPWAFHVSFSPDGHRVVTSGGDRTARIWDVGTGQPVTPPLRHAGEVHFAAFSPDGARVVTASDDATARVWDAATSEPLTPLLPHNGKVVGAAFSPDGRRVVTASADGAARVWDLAGSLAPTPPLRMSGQAYQTAFSPDGHRLVTASGYDEARLWEPATGRSLSLPHKDSVNRAAFSRDGRRVVTASKDTTAKMWDAITGKPVTPPLTHRGPVLDASFSLDGRRVVTASADQTAQVWDAATGKRAGAPLRHQGPVNTAVFSADGRYVVTASADQTARVWEVATGKALSARMRHQGPVLGARFSPDGRRVVTASRDGTARVWNAAAGRRVTSPLRHGDRVMAALFSPDGRRVVTASADATARVWDAATGWPVTPPLKHEHVVGYAEFSPDGHYVVTASWDNTARVWDAATGEPVSPPLHHDHRVLFASFSPDGRHIATATFNGTVSLWDVPRDPRPLPELERLARLLAAHRLDTTGGIVTDDPRVLRTSWEALRRRYPETFCPAPGQVLAWHSREVEPCAKVGRWRLAVSHLDALIQATPADWRPRRDRAFVHAELGKWETAAADFEKAITLGDGDVADACLCAWTRLAAGDADGYRRCCARLLERGFKAEEPTDIGRVVQTCTLTADALRDSSHLMQLAQRLIAKRSLNPGLGVTLGAALYRAGHFAEAADRLNEATSMRDPNRVVEKWLYLAMAHARLEHATEARQYLEKAVQQIEQEERHWRDDPSYRGWGWQTRLRCQLLRREAEGLLR